MRKFWTYILTNKERTVLYTGMTNNLPMRLIAHYLGEATTFTAQYRAHYLLWSEETRYVNNAIRREKEIKSWMRFRKEALINESNPDWRFLNTEHLECWPPTDAMIAACAEWMRLDEAEKQARVTAKTLQQQQRQQGQ